MRMNSSNPVFRQANSYTLASDKPITYTNVAIKTIVLLSVAAISAYLTMTNLETINIGWIIGAMIVAFIAVIVGTRSVRLAPFAAIIYAVAEGLVLGMVSVLYMFYYGNQIVPTALATTFIVFLVMLLLFSTNIIKVNQKFASFMVVALISVIIMSLLSIFINMGELYYIVVFISAALSAFFLLLDFQRIKDFVDSGTDQRVGWILSLGLMVTIVWIYVEMLRLLAISSRR
ncbi:MAG: Bax inhibitor-1/YccA family protein [Candidatus Izemoplasmatales bacterium]|nr:Bax inhibitor-1/YccA family protein [Candidatus Izemoplasmatales bacterium]